MRGKGCHRRINSVQRPTVLPSPPYWGWSRNFFAGNHKSNTASQVRSGTARYWFGRPLGVVLRGELSGPHNPTIAVIHTTYNASPCQARASI
jgi:hypothetical protein